MQLLSLYLRAPFFVKRLFVNAEAIRRDFYRKFKGYEDLYNSINFSAVMTQTGLQEKTQLIDMLLIYIQKNVSYYRNLPLSSTLNELPLMTKTEFIKNTRTLIADGIDRSNCWVGHTSGSTGTPLTYLNHRDIERTIKVYQEKFIEHIGINLKERSARISGVQITTYDRKKPPYWIYIDRYKQLQFSAFHISSNTHASYIDAMKKYKVTYGKGYASAWLFLAEYIISSGDSPPPLKGIVTDSEGVTIDKQRFIENAFKCPVYQTYGLSETGQIAVQCREGHYHIIPTLCHAEIVDDENIKLPNGYLGEIVLTNLISGKTPFVRYKTGDYGILEEGRCRCGWNTQYLTLIDGRTDDYVYGQDGRKIGRLSHVIKPAIGVVESQIIQEKMGEIKLLVVPGKDFSASSMDAVVSNAQNYLGNLTIKWELAKELEKTKSFKIRRVIRKVH